MSQNNTVCFKCGLELIEEEKSTHECFNGIKNAVFDTSYPHSFFAFDGKNWHKCPTKFDKNKIRRRLDRII